jgi:hypothetical protein
MDTILGGKSMANLAHTLQRTTVKDGAPDKIILSDLQTFRIQNRRGGSVRIQGLQGVIYITAPNDLKDYMVTSGEAIVVRQPGMILIQGLPSGTFRYSEI